MGTLSRDGEVVVECVNRLGWRKGPRVGRFIMTWRIAEDQLGDAITIEDFQKWWEEGSRTTAYERLAELRQAFPEYGPKGTPRDVLGAPAAPKARSAASSRALTGVG